MNRGGLLISHLAFVDDLILFVEANMDQVDVINLTLKLFCDSSGAKVNVDKTKSFFFSKNVNWWVEEDISSGMGLQSTDDLGTYLGVPIFHKNPTSHTFDFIIDKVNKRFSRWKSNLLSMVGRLTLAK